MPHGQKHLPLLVHEFCHLRIVVVQVYAAGRHGFADVFTTPGIFLDADFPQVVSLLGKDRVLVAGLFNRYASYTPPPICGEKHFYS